MMNFVQQTNERTNKTTNGRTDKKPITRRKKNNKQTTKIGQIKYACIVYELVFTCCRYCCSKFINAKASHDLVVFVSQILPSSTRCSQSIGLPTSNHWFDEAEKLTYSFDTCDAHNWVLIYRSYNIYSNKRAASWQTEINHDG